VKGERGRGVTRIVKLDFGREEESIERIEKERENKKERRIRK
jgi:hypothetical protein